MHGSGTKLSIAKMSWHKLSFWSLPHYMLDPSALHLLHQKGLALLQLRISQRISKFRNNKPQRNEELCTAACVSWVLSFLPASFVMLPSMTQKIWLDLYSWKIASRNEKVTWSLHLLKKRSIVPSSTVVTRRCSPGKSRFRQFPSCRVVGSWRTLGMYPPLALSLHSSPQPHCPWNWLPCPSTMEERESVECTQQK